MRLRNEALGTGSLLVRAHPDGPHHNASLLFLVEGAADIQTLRDIELACASIVGDRYRWHTVANQQDLTSVGLRIDPARVTRLEVAELRGLSLEKLRLLLTPALGQLQLGHPCFPSATRVEGGVAQGVDFLGREEEQVHLRELLTRGEHVLLVAPRRSGKTSLLRRFAEAATPELQPVFVDAQPFQSAEALTAGLMAQLTGQRFTEVLKQVRARGWPEALRDTVRALASGPKPLVLILDELVFLLDTIRRPADVLALLHALDSAVSGAGARLLIAGSLSLEQLARDIGIEALPGVFGALRRFPLPPLAQGRLALDLRRVLMGTGLVADPADLDWLMANVDLGMPYPALRFLAHLASSAYEGPLSTAALEQELADYLSRTEVFADLFNQLRWMAQKELAAAQAVEGVLDRLSQSPRPLHVMDVRAWLGDTETEQVRRFTWLMENFPVTLDGEQVRMASRLFQRFWRMQQEVSR
ncbi:AAA family ATPase [Pyxidicoccus caerfyrddinensis]|uniref:AAA family ATPase n=1 Tax=Pyxidicoccus caerfyrddinensis TaxID=2709663 RepID=UPI0013DA7DAC|nr:ATP-binding protein [Pyxidicoccus caerfyrddinensis]